MAFTPTYLYIKRHALTGLLYFGKTSRANPIQYLGSGKYWLSHIKKHGSKHVETIWYCLYEDKETLIKDALSLSKNMNIVESNNWANLMDENGVDGRTPGCKLSNEHKINILQAVANRSDEARRKISKKLSEARRGKKHLEETKQKMSMSKMGKRGRKYSAETRQKLSDARKGVPKSGEHKRRIGDANRNKIRNPMSEETRRKMSEARAQYWAKIKSTV